MKILPSFTDLVNILSALVLIGLSIFAINYIFIKTTNLGAFLNTGYSMCKYQDPLLEMLPINDDECSWVPINLLLLYPLKNPEMLKVGTNVCYEKQDSLICHRIFDKKIENGKVYYWIEGLHPNALKEWVPAEKVKYLVVDKFPRAIGGPMFVVMFAFADPIRMYIYINKGFYI